MYQLTGYLKGHFENNTSNGRVLNFYVKSGGHYNKKEEKYVNYEYPFETWLEPLIDKVKAAPRESLVTVQFDIVPRRVKVGEKSFTQNCLKANSVTIWTKERRESASERSTEHMFVQQVLFSDPQE